MQQAQGALRSLALTDPAEAHVAIRELSAVSKVDVDVLMRVLFKRR